MTSDTSSQLHRAVEVRLHRAEGERLDGDRYRTHTGADPWAQARTTLRLWSSTAPNDGSVDKTDFTVVYDDGFVYSGTFGLTYADWDLPTHIRQFVEHVIEHQEHYQHVDLDTFEGFLHSYEIGRP